MRLARLDLLRYGHLSDAALGFDGDAALHVVLGLNEAGKSTALAAIADALFGFSHRTDFDFLHGSAALRIGVRLAAADGASAGFVRRKGRRDTLRDEAGEVVPEEAVRRFLGGIDRERFECGFGLDGERLRQGGQDLLRSGGEAGESLLAGGGLLHLRPTLARLDEEARALVGDGRGRRRLSDALETWRQATREIDARAVAPKAWQEAEATHARAASELLALQEETRKLATEGSRLQRVRRTAPLLAGLAAARAQAGELADAPLVAADAERRLAGLSARTAEAARDAERETAEAARLTALRDVLPRDEAMLSVQDGVDALLLRRPVAAEAADDLPEVRAAIAAHRARVSEVLADLGVPYTAEAAREAVPGAAVRRRVQQLVSRHAGLVATEAAASAAMEVARGRRDRAEAALMQCKAPPASAPLRRGIERIRGEGPIEAERDRARRAADEAASVAAASLAALPLWTGGLDGLLACPLPLPAAIEAASVALDVASSALEQARTARAALADETAALQDEVARLSRGEPVPTPATVAQARLKRDALWQRVRRAPEGDGAADAYEALRDEADRLADRRADEAQRVADYLAATARLALLDERAPLAERALAEAQDALEAARGAWTTLWASADVIPGAPAAMVEWRAARAETIRLGQEARKAAQEFEAWRDRSDRAVALLSGLLAPLTPATSLAALLLRAEAQCEADERDQAAHRACVDALAGEEARLLELRQAAAAGEAARAAWRAEWAPAVAPLGFAADVPVDSMEPVLGAWGRIAEIAPAWRTDAQRVVDMAATLADFTNETRALHAALGEPPSEESAPVIAARLGRRLAEARNTDTQAAALSERILRHRAAADEAARLQRAAEAELALLREAAGVEDDAGLRRAIERARQREAARAEIARLGAALLAQGDGLDEGKLSAEVDSVDADAAVARLAEIEQALQALGVQREQGSAARTRAEAALAAMRAGQDAAASAQQAEDALAQARAHAERYGRLRVAQVLLRAGIERFRERQQGPLLRAAGEHFALLTGGRYAGLTAEQDAAGRAMLHAVRDSGAECPVEALSEGTRDQLYLALRVAAVEAHAARSEPIPFVADDLLVHFDDDRARAAIALLARLGRTTQVILFTHHAHIAVLAAPLPAVAVQHLAA